jgi:hypothetical protein
MPKSDEHLAFIGRLAPGAAALRAADEVKRRPELLEAVIAGLGSDKAPTKFGAAKALMILSEQAPELLYPHFDFLARLLKHQNSIFRWNATLVLGNLAVVDREKKLERMLDAYLAPISGPDMISAGNVIRGAAAIAVAKPQLADAIARGILKVARASYATPECRNVAIGHAIGALARFFPAIGDKRPVQLFVRRQLNNSRRATRTKAERFLKKWPMERARRAAGTKHLRAPAG